jgi:hypothetical protein
MKNGKLTPVKAKIRFDYKAEMESRQFFWQRRDLRQIAKEIRTRQAALLKNMPFQGLSVEALNLEYDAYLVPGAGNMKETAYAPVELVVQADSIEDLMQLTLKEEFRTIRVIEPEEMLLSNGEVERLLFKVYEEYREELE